MNHEARIIADIGRHALIDDLKARWDWRMSEPIAAPTPKGLTSTYRKTSLHLDPVQQQRALDLYPLLTLSEIARMAIDLVIELRPVHEPPRFVLRSIPNNYNYLYDLNKITHVEPPDFNKSTNEREPK